MNSAPFITLVRLFRNGVPCQSNRKKSPNLSSACLCLSALKISDHPKSTDFGSAHLAISGARQEGRAPDGWLGIDRERRKLARSELIGYG